MPKGDYPVNTKWKNTREFNNYWISRLLAEIHANSTLASAIYTDAIPVVSKGGLLDQIDPGARKAIGKQAMRDLRTKASAYMQNVIPYLSLIAEHAKYGPKKPPYVADYKPTPNPSTSAQIQDAIKRRIMYRFVKRYGLKNDSATQKLLWHLRAKETRKGSRALDEALRNAKKLMQDLGFGANLFGIGGDSSIDSGVDDEGGLGFFSGGLGGTDQDGNRASPHQSGDGDGSGTGGNAPADADAGTMSIHASEAAAWEDYAYQAAPTVTATATECTEKGDTGECKDEEVPHDPDAATTPGPDGGYGDKMTPEEWGRAMFGAWVDERHARAQIMEEEIAYNRAGLDSFIRSLGQRPRTHWAGEAETAEEVRHYIQDEVRRTGESPGAAGELAQQEYMFESGIYDPIPQYARSATMAADADGQVEIGERGDGDGDG